jgi:hypothetical protein
MRATLHIGVYMIRGDLVMTYTGGAAEPAASQIADTARS